MAKVVRSGHGKGARSPLLANISDDQARKLVSAFKPANTAREGRIAEVKVATPVLIRIKSKAGRSEKYVLSSKKLKAG